MGITHAKVSNKLDGGDSTLVRPSDWNAKHVSGSWKELSDYATLQAAITAIGATETTLILDASKNASNTVEPVTVPPTLSLMPMRGGMITKGSATLLTINSAPVGNPMHQWLNGFAAGDVVFGSRQAFNPIWVGFKEGSGLGAANSVAWAVMMNALPSANRRPIIWVLYGLYEIAGDPAILIDRSCTIYWNKAIFKQTDYSQNHAAVKINKGSTGVSLSEVTIYEPVITNGIGGALDYTRLNDSNPATMEGSGLVISGCAGFVIHHPFIDGFRQNLYITSTVGGDSVSLGEIHAPQLRNGLRNIYIRTGSGASPAITAINFFSGITGSNGSCAGTNVIQCEILNDSTSNLIDGINFYGTGIEDNTSPNKLKLSGSAGKYVHRCSFNNIYWDNSSGFDNDINIGANCTSNMFVGGANLEIQRITDNGTNTYFALPENRTKDLDMAAGSQTLMTIQSAYNVLNCTGILTAAVNVYVTPHKKTYTVINNTTGAYSLWVYVVGGAGVGIQVLQGEKAMLYCDGTDIHMVSKRTTVQVDSTATTVLDLKNDFNDLLTRLRTAKLMVT